MRVVLTDRFQDDADGHYFWLLVNRPSGAAPAWAAAVRNAVRAAATNADGHPVCSDPLVSGRGLRQRAFGPGRRPTHRLIFEVDAAAGEVRFLACRGLSRPDLTPADLR